MNFLKGLLISFYAVYFIHCQTDPSIGDLWKNPEYMVVSKEPLCLDIHLDISKDLINAKGKEFLEGYLRDVISEVSRVLSWHNIRLNIAEVDRWEEYDLMKVGTSIDDTFENYRFRINNLPQRQDLHILLVDFVSTGTAVGKGYINGVCLPNAFMVSQAGSQLNWDPKFVASVMSHEIGHTLGFEHVFPGLNATCKCAFGEDRCLMSTKASRLHESLPVGYESCNMQRLIDNPKRCLLDCNVKRKHDGPAVCGDNIVQTGEECDCSFEEACILTGRDKCCDSKTCKFKSSDMECMEGKCCSDCKYTRGNLCQSKTNECDMDDFCTGYSEYCPDYVRQTGLKCANDTAYCYEGNCATPDYGCKKMFPNSIGVAWSKECQDYAKSQESRGCPTLTNLVLKEMFCGTGAGPCGQLYCSVQAAGDPTYGFKIGTTACITQTNQQTYDSRNKRPYGSLCGPEQACYEEGCTDASRINYTCDAKCQTYEECEGFSRTCKPNDARWFTLPENQR